MAALSKTHRCIAPDLKGYGQSEKGPGNYTHEGASEQLFAMLKLTQVDPFNLVTHDRGTVQGDYIVANHPEAVLRYGRGEQHLFNFNPNVAPQGDIFMQAPYTGMMEDATRFVCWVHGWVGGKPIIDEEFERCIQEHSYPGISRAVPRYFNSSTFRSEWLDRRNRLLNAWKCPVLIMQGYNSKSQPREFYERSREYIPNAKDVAVTYIPGGHFWTMENPKETTEAIKKLLTM
jgi:pimeloyl-ACP methyl ester carboxylesterase